MGGERDSAPPGVPRLALASLLVPNRNNPCRGVACGLLPWCAGARGLAALMPPEWTVELVLLQAVSVSKRAGEDIRGHACPGSLLSPKAEHPDVRDCPGVRLVSPSPALRAAVKDFASRLREQLPPHRKPWVDNMGATLYK